MILYHVQDGLKRFSEVRRSFSGISEKVLAQQLRHLVAMCVLERHDQHRVPPMVDYSLTIFGKTLVEALIPLCKWGNRNRARVTEISRNVSGTKIK